MSGAAELVAWHLVLAGPLKLYAGLDDIARHRLDLFVSVTDA
jgi:hypothetical protein